MSIFKIPVSSIGETGYAFDATAPVEDIQPPATMDLPIRQVKVSGTVVSVGETFLFRGEISGTFEDACYRCLAPARVRIALEVTWVFGMNASGSFEEIGRASDRGDDDEAPVELRSVEVQRGAQAPEIDLAPCVWEELVFAQPSRFVCEETCRGMCPRCGVNLNKEVCRCADVSTGEAEGNSGLAALARLFPELAPEKKKE